LIRADNQATGIVRVTRELTLWALAHRKDAVFVICDLAHGGGELRCLNPDWVEKILFKSAKIDVSSLPDRWRADKIRIREHLPRPLGALLMWIQHPRRRLIIALERWRLGASSEMAPRIERLQDRIMSDKNRREFSDSANRRLPILSYDVAVTGKLSLRQGDILVMTGCDWGETRPHSYQEIKTGHGIKIAWLCYDIIPLLFPHFYSRQVVRNFRDYAHEVLPAADLVLLSARAVEADMRKYCLASNLPAPTTRIVQFGADLSEGKARPDVALPAGLQAGRYALFVSTIEPRKGHRLLFSVWKRLLRDGVPQATGFKLVFVGRTGWLVDDLVEEMEAHPSAGDSLFILKGIGDAELASLYRNAAFCLYPSLYEGYGLPIVEAFGYGKAVLSSNGGALPETVGDFSPKIDPTDEDAWYQALKQWIESPQARVSFEAAIRERFRHPTWDEAARAFFDTVDEALH
jgi:glycosyltransferase involved in cell wall biosynthesis